MLRYLVAIVTLLVLTPVAEARHRAPAHDPNCNITMPCDFSYGPDVFKEARRVARGEQVVKAMGGFGSVRHHDDPIPEVRRHHIIHRITPRTDVPATQIVEHPSGCPHSAFCGCGAAVRVFGRPIRELWLAANWFRFPRAAPAPGMVAVARHHVFVLEHQIDGNIWMSYDANSGGHATRIHARSIAGYQIVDPHGGRN